MFILLALPLLLPIGAIVAIAVWIKLGQPVFFTQLRPGLNGAPFRMIKFRTMREARDSRGELLPDAERMTALGQFLRRASLDELPEFWNVLKGEMSLVGPRPLLVEYLELYSPQQARRHDVRPGITGWAQVNGRNAITWEEKFAHDVWYVDNLSFWLDIRILAKTVLSMVSGRGVSASEHVTMPPFTGENSGSGKK